VIYGMIFECSDETCPLTGRSGPKRMWMAGYIIIAASALGSGFCQTRIQFDVLRGLAGLGVACSRE
jgi:MFS family permease